MLKNYRIPLLILCIGCLEGATYLWAVWTTEEVHFIFAKCARNSGRASAALNLIVLVIVGYYGLKKIYKEGNKKDVFRILLTLFAVNHLIHFFYIYQNFKSQEKVLDLSANMHGIITFGFVLLVPIVLWSFRNLNKVLYFGVIVHLFNTTYFMIETFYTKIKFDSPAYLHQIEIAIMISLLLYILYRVFREMTTRFTGLDKGIGHKY